MGWLSRLARSFGALSTSDITTIILIVGEASGVFAGFCPSWFTVSSPFFHEQEARAGNIKRIRWGEGAASVVVLSTGWAVSYRQVSNAPLVASVLICSIFIGGYEYMIRHPATEDGKGQPDQPSPSADRSALPLSQRIRRAGRAA